MDEELLPADLVAQAQAMWRSEFWQRIARYVRARRDELVARRAAVDATEKQLSAIDALVEKGPLSPTLLQLQLNAQEALANAKQIELASRITFNNSLSRLARATGTTMQQNNIRITAEDVISGSQLRPVMPSAPMPSSAPTTTPAAPATLDPRP